MSKPNLVLINTIDTAQEELPEEFVLFKESLPPDTQISMFDIIPHEEDSDNWFVQYLNGLEKE